MSKLGPRAVGFLPDANDPRRVWVHLGGDLEASYDGERYVDVRLRKRRGGRTHRSRLFLSKGALKKALTLFNPAPRFE